MRKPAISRYPGIHIHVYLFCCYSSYMMTRCDGDVLTRSPSTKWEQKIWLVFSTGHISGNKAADLSSIFHSCHHSTHIPHESLTDYHKLFCGLLQGSNRCLLFAGHQWRRHYQPQMSCLWPLQFSTNYDGQRCTLCKISPLTVIHPCWLPYAPADYTLHSRPSK